MNAIHRDDFSEVHEGVFGRNRGTLLAGAEVRIDYEHSRIIIDSSLWRHVPPKFFTAAANDGVHKRGIIDRLLDLVAKLHSAPGSWIR